MSPHGNQDCEKTFHLLQEARLLVLGMDRLQLSTNFEAKRRGSPTFRGRNTLTSAGRHYRTPVRGVGGDFSDLSPKQLAAEENRCFSPYLVPRGAAS